MTVKKYYVLLTFFFIGILCINLLKVQVVRADEGTPTEPPAATEVVTQPAAQASSVPVETQAPSQEATVVPAMQPSEEAPSTASNGGENQSAQVVSIQGLENTEIVVLDEQGQALVLGSQAAMTAIGNSDPGWCPASVTTPTPGANGCSVSYASITDILAAMQAYLPLSRIGIVFNPQERNSASNVEALTQLAASRDIEVLAAAVPAGADGEPLAGVAVVLRHAGVRDRVHELLVGRRGLMGFRGGQPCDLFPARGQTGAVFLREARVVAEVTEQHRQLPALGVGSGALSERRQSRRRTRCGALGLFPPH